MIEFKEGTVVIVSTGQAGTIVQNTNNGLWILLTNGDIYVGPKHAARIPQDSIDLDSCPLNVERTEPKRIRSDKD